MKLGRKPLPLERLEEIEAVYARTGSIRKTARACGVSRKTVQNYLRRKRGESWKPSKPYQCICAKCSREFRAPTAGQQYCSRDCARFSGRLGRPRLPRPECEFCGKPCRWPRNRHCSKSCARKHWFARRRFLAAPAVR